MTNPRRIDRNSATWVAVVALVLTLFAAALLNGCDDANALATPDDGTGACALRREDINGAAIVMDATSTAPACAREAHALIGGTVGVDAGKLHGAETIELTDVRAYASEGGMLCALTARGVLDQPVQGCAIDLTVSLTVRL